MAALTLCRPSQGELKAAELGLGKVVAVLEPLAARERAAAVAARLKAVQKAAHAAAAAAVPDTPDGAPPRPSARDRRLQQAGPFEPVVAARLGRLRNSPAN